MTPIKVFVGKPTPVEKPSEPQRPQQQYATIPAAVGAAIRRQQEPQQG